MRRTRALLTSAVAIVWIAASPHAARAAETCGDGVDNDSDLMADEGCNPAAVTGVCESPLDCSQTGQIAPKSGNVTYRLPQDLNIATPYGPSLTFQRFYVSQYEPGGGAPAYRTSMGPHWGHEYMSWLDKNTTPNPDQVIVHLPDGRDVLFQYSSTSGGHDYYTPQEGFHADYLRQSTSTPYGWELRSLTGEVLEYDWSSPTGKLTGIKDSVGNKLSVSYNGSGLVDKVVDASGKKRLLFGYTGSVVTSVDYQTVDGGTPTTRVTVAITYTSGNPTAVSIGGSSVQTMQYTSGYLTKVLDAGSNDLIAYQYLSGASGKVVRATTEAGEIGFDYSGARADCSGGLVIGFNRASATACDDDADCGSDYVCAGETNPAAANTGVCYRAARCVTTTSPDEDLIDTVAAISGGGGGSGGCTGACAPTTEYDWGSTPDLAGTEQADGTWTSYQRNSDGMVTLMARGDTDSDPTNAGGHKTWFFYGDSNFPGRVTETRRLSELKAFQPSVSCDASNTTDCTRSIYTYTAGGQVATRNDQGFTLDATGATVSYSYTTSYSYDAYGRLTQVDGPLSGSHDVTDYTYWSSTDVLKDGYRKEIKRKKDSSSYVVTTLAEYGIWGTATSQQDPDGTYTCSTYDAGRGALTETRVAMAGQTSCGTVDGTDLVTTYTYDSALRLTRTQRPIGNCEHREYDTRGRIWKIKERDDCNAVSSGDTIQYNYATSGDVVQSIKYLDAAGNIKRELEYAYTDGMQLAQDINPVNKSYWKAFTYGSDGKLSQVDHENGLGKTAWLWDTLDREDALRRYKTASTYDEWDTSYAAQLGRPRQVEDDDAKSITTTWDDLGRKVKVVSPDSGTTLYVQDAAGRVVTMVEADGTAGEVSHAFTYDHLGRMLTADYGTENCGVGQPVDIEYGYDTPPVSCPGGATCARQAGRLAYVRSTLLCNASYGDKTLDQEVFYSYDAAGRVEQEYLRDDSGRVAAQSYEWDKNGNNTKVTAPSGTYMSWVFGSTDNSDRDKVSSLTRSGTTVASSFKWLPFGPVSSYRQQNLTNVNIKVDAKLTWNAAYRPASVLYEDMLGADLFQIVYSEDAKGRTTVRDYSSAATGVQDAYFTYDWQDRLLCDAAVSGSCPTSGTNLKSNINGSPPYTASNDRTQILHRHPSYGTYTYTFTLASGKDQIASMTTSPSTGTTTFTWDDRGNRTGDDSNAYSNDERTYTYDGRSNVRQITGKRYVWPSWQTYTLTNAYDHKGRRVFKSYSAGGSEAQWFFYYDLEDRLIEVKHTPNISSPSTYSIYQFYWVGRRAIAYWQIDYPAVTTTRRFLHSDESDRVLEAWSWPTSGYTARQWALNDDAFGWDEVVLGVAIFQPLRERGSFRYYDGETTSLNGSASGLRPPLLASASSARRVEDSLTATTFVPVASRTMFQRGPTAGGYARPSDYTEVLAEDGEACNKPGGPCCQGYSQNFEGTCVIDDSSMFGGSVWDGTLAGSACADAEWNGGWWDPGGCDIGEPLPPDDPSGDDQGADPDPENPNCNRPGAPPGSICNEGGVDNPRPPPHCVRQCLGPMDVGLQFCLNDGLHSPYECAELAAAFYQRCIRQCYTSPSDTGQATPWGHWHWVVNSITGD